MRLLDKAEKEVITMKLFSIGNLKIGTDTMILT